MPMLLAVLLLGGCNGLPGRTDPPPGFRLLAGTYQLTRDLESPAAVWTRTNVGSTSPVFEPIERKIAYAPVAHRFTADDVDLSGHVRLYVDEAANQHWIPMLVTAFTVPGACPAENVPLFADLARGLGKGKAIVILEPRLLSGACKDSAMVARYLAAAGKTSRGGA
jgi:endoglucanase